MNLRPYQTQAIQDLRAAYGGGAKAPLLFLPTAAGKTVCFAAIARATEDKGGRVLVIVHRNELLLQAVEKLRHAGLDPGVISANATMQLDKRSQVASVQTITRRFDRIGERFAPTLLIFDEAHHCQEENQWGKVRAQWQNARVLGVTATPVRSDGGGLDDVFDSLVLGPSVRQLTDDGYLSPTEIYAPPVVVDLASVRKQCGDFAKGELDAAMDKPTITGDAVEHYRRICPGVPAIAFCVSVSHAEHVAEQFRTSGFRAASIDGGMDMSQRRLNIQMLGNGELDVLTSCDVVSEGTDIPVVGAAILLRPTMSEGLYLQQVGRVLRLSPGKTKAIILDHVGNVRRHGMPCADREWSLSGAGKEGGAKREGPPPPITCTGCFRQIVRPCPPACPYCGADLRPIGREEKLKEVAGELARIEAGEADAMRKRARSEQGRAQTMEQLIALGYERGMNNPQAWARHVHRARNRG